MTSDFEPTVIPAGESAGLFDTACTRVRDMTRARCAVVIVIDGESGSGYSVVAHSRRRFFCQTSCTRSQTPCAGSSRKICSNLPFVSPYVSNRRPIINGWQKIVDLPKHWRRSIAVLRPTTTNCLPAGPDAGNLTLEG